MSTFQLLTCFLKAFAPFGAKLSVASHICGKGEHTSIMLIVRRCKVL